MNAKILAFVICVEARMLENLANILGWSENIFAII